MEQLKISTLDDFIQILNIKNKEDKDKLCFAYNFSKIKFKWMLKNSWEPYFYHLVKTTEILINELNIKEIDTVVLALIHDLKEDTTSKKIKRKINETKEYLLPLAEKYSKEGYLIIKREIRKLENYLSKKELIKELESVNIN